MSIIIAWNGKYRYIVIVHIYCGIWRGKSISFQYFSGFSFSANASQQQQHPFRESTIGHNIEILWNIIYIIARWMHICSKLVHSSELLETEHIVIYLFIFSVVFLFAVFILCLFACGCWCVFVRSIFISVFVECPWRVAPLSAERFRRDRCCDNRCHFG